jgi:hypothetical protein
MEHCDTENIGGPMGTNTLLTVLEEHGDRYVLLQNDEKYIRFGALQRDLRVLDKATQFEFGEIKVEKRGTKEDAWAVTYLGDCYHALEGIFVYEPSPSNRSKDFIAATRFSKRNAIELAIQLQKDMEKPRKK